MKYKAQGKKNKRNRVRHWMSAPFIYLVIFPTILLDGILELYHRICFPLYNMPLINRTEYIRVDRHKLSYMTYFDRLNCMYCGYMNGFFIYAKEIAGKTEEYWCGIKHQRDIDNALAAQEAKYLPYGDENAYKEV